MYCHIFSFLFCVLIIFYTNVYISLSILRCLNKVCTMSVAMQVLPTWASPSITTLNDYKSTSLVAKVDSAIDIDDPIT